MTFSSLYSNSFLQSFHVGKIMISYCHILDAGQTRGDITSGYLLVDLGANLQNLLNWRQLKASESPLFSVLTCFTKNSSVVHQVVQYNQMQ